MVKKSITPIDFPGSARNWQGTNDFVNSDDLSQEASAENDLLNNIVVTDVSFFMLLTKVTICQKSNKIINFASNEN